MTHDPFTDEDRAQLEARGVSLDEARRQLALLASPPPALRIDRPCTTGDGIERLDPARFAELGAGADAAAAAGRALAFVPASGAASRMFQDLLACRSAGGRLERAEVEAMAAGGDAAAAARGLLAFVDGVPRFAFRGALAHELAVRGRRLEDLLAAGPWRPLLDALLDDEGLGYARLPKALIEFHDDDDGSRSAFDEHLVDAARALRDAHGTARLHVTVAPEHLERFRESLARARVHWGPRLGARWDVTFSVQDPATDTLAAEADGRPFRDAHGGLLFRPAGHGALLRNLAACGADLAFVRNVDNVAAAPHKAPQLAWARALLGLAEETRALAHAALARIEADGDAAVDEAAGLLERLFHEPPPAAADAAARRAWAVAALDRPVRVCGMVPNTGEPGGGPYWVRGTDGAVTRQIVESVQVDHADPAQHAAFRAGTHFNPVFMALALRDRLGRPHDLARFVDELAAIVTRKSADGRALLALERPGLWNGAMARWSTRFVEVPLATFVPAKTVLDLLRREHRPA